MGIDIKPGIQPYINEVVSTINIHLERIRNYYPKNNPKSFKTRDSKREEGTFQQHIFKGEQKIKKRLKGLNINNNMDHVQFEFYDETIATIPMKEVLCLRNPLIAAKVESLEANWELIIDNGLFINMDRKDVPEYNPDKHFWEQDPDVLQFWISEYNKIKHGYDIDGYHMSGWMYFHINFFKTPIKNLDNKITNPPLRDNEWYFDEIVKYAEKKASEMEDAGVIIYGTRRFAKTTDEASHFHRGIIIFPTETGSLSSSNGEDLESIIDKLKKSLEYIEPAFRINILSGKDFDTKKPTRFGLKSKSGRESYEHFSLRIINTDSGSKKGSQKTAGGNPKIYVSDEIGKSSFIKAYEAAIHSFESDDGWVTIPIHTGTGGDEDLSEDAQKVLTDPTNYRFLEMDWDILEYKIPKEAITWKRRKFGWFIPAQMSTYTRMRKIETNLADFLDLDSEELRKVKFFQTDWVHNSEVIRQKRKKLKGAQLISEKVFRPIDPEECFMSAKNNPFPATEAKMRKERLIAEGNEETGTGKPVLLERDEKDPTKIRIRDGYKKSIAKWPHPGGFIDSPFILYEADIPDTKPPMYRYVAGFDDYKHEQSDGDSVGAFYIFDRIKRKIVLSIATRPNPHGLLHKQIHMALDAYNAICFPENEDMDIKKYFDKLGLSYKYLGEGFDVSAKLNFNNTGNRKYGWQPGKFTTPFAIGLVIDYCKQEIEIKDEDGNVIDIKLGIELIEDIHLLEEIVMYKEDGNYDRIIAFASALFYDHYCTITYKVPRIIKKKKEEENSRWVGNQKQKKSRNKYFNKTRRKLL